MKLFKLEKDMAKIIINYLNENNLDVYQEVDVRPTAGIIDIVAKKNNIIWCIECKLSLSLNVIQQAFKHINYSNYTSIAVPDVKYKNSIIIHEILPKLKIGLMLVSYNDVYESIKAKLIRKAYTHLYNKKLHPMQKILCDAGSKNGGYFTSFNNTKIQVIRYIENNPGCTIQNVIDNINHHYRTVSSAKSSLIHWIKEGVIKEIEIKRNGKSNTLHIKKHD